jgi:hypothetical protein
MSIFKLTQFFNFSSEVWEETLTTKTTSSTEPWGGDVQVPCSSISMVTEPKHQDSSCCPNSRP